MFDKFERLPKEKQKRIINAVINELAAKGYKLSSTDIIAKEAGISKGSLFNYFKNKKGMFRYVFDYSIEITLKAFYEDMDLSKTDVIDRYKKAILIKLKLLKEYPEIFNFFTKVTFENDNEVKDIIQDRIIKITKESYGKIFSGLDLGVFKEEIDANKAINVIVWTLQGLSNQLLEKYRRMNVSFDQIDYENLMNELDEYLLILKQGLYK